MSSSANASAARLIRAGRRRFRVIEEQETPFWDKVEAGRWEPATLGALARLTGPGALLVDVGAWIGPTALFAASGGAQVIALEPDPVAAEMLQANLALNPELARRVEVLEAALWPQEGLVRLAADRGRGGKSTSSVLHREASVEWERPVVTPAALAARLPEAERVILKIDVEGGEYPLAGALKPLTSRADAVLLSLHPQVALAGLAGLRRFARRISLARAGARLAADLRSFSARPIADVSGAWGAAASLRGGEWLFERRASLATRGHGG